LKAPFAGVVTAVNIVPGSSASSSVAAVSLLDRSTLHVDLKLSENDVAKVQLGQPVALTIDALKDWKAAGTVSYIAPSAETSNGVVTYAVRVSFPDSDARVKIGMTANLSITTAQKNNVLLAPNSALLPKGAGHSVQLTSADGKTTSEVDVQTGLSDGTQTEITSGLKAGDKIVTTPSTTKTTSGGLFGR
jgi:HlyD family secretion protein